VTMGSGINTIGYEAFYGCENLTDVYYNGTQAQWNEITIGEDNEYLLKATIHFAEEPVEPTDPVDPEPTEPAFDQTTVCEHCGAVPAGGWTSITENSSAEITADGHYYLTRDIVKDSKGGLMLPAYNICLNLNGYSIEGGSTNGRAISVTGGTLNIMGEGTVTTTGIMGAILCTGATVNLYGGTYGAPAGEHALRVSGGAINVYGGTVNGTLYVYEGAALSISGGTFSVDPTAYVAEGYRAVQTGNVWAVVEDIPLVLPTTCPGCGATDLTETDWTELTSSGISVSVTEHKHYYLGYDVMIEGLGNTIQLGADQCLYLNGHTLTNNGRIRARSGYSIHFFGEGNYVRPDTESTYGMFDGSASNAIYIHGGNWTYSDPDVAVVNGTIIVDGGTFNFDPSDYVADGYKATEADGVWTVEEDHNCVWDEGVQIQAPTCTAEGVMTYTCTVDGCEETKTEPIAKLPHDFSANGPTCANCTEPNPDYVAPDLPATCPGCGKTVTEWIPVTAATGTRDWDKGSGHFYLANDLASSAKRTFQFIAGDEICLLLNGHNITNTSTLSGAITLRSYGTVRIMGEGTVSTGDNTAAMGAVIAYTDGIVEIYGGNYYSNTGNDAVRVNGGTAIIYGGTFSRDPSAYVAEGYKAIANADGTWTVEKSNDLKDPENPDYTYIVENGEATITGYTGTGGDVTIPATLGGYPVTTIGDEAFYSCRGMTSVTIPDSVTTIGGWAFDSCENLTSVTIPDNVTTLGNGAFAYCSSLTSVTIGDGVTAVSMYAFHECESLASVTIGNNVKTIGAEALFSCYNLTEVTIPDSVTTIDNYAFANCYSLTDVYYNGTEEQWDEIAVGTYNDDLLFATIHFNWGHEHTYTNYVSNGDATCTEDGTETAKCDLCEEKDTRTDEGSALGHIEQAIAGYPAECEKAGLTDGVICTVCGSILVEQEEIAPTGHVIMIDEAIAPTCIATGLTQGEHCVVCGQVLIAQEIVEKLPHIEGEIVVENRVEPTCVDAGSYDNVVYCTACGTEMYRETVTIMSPPHVAGEMVVENEIPADHLKDAQHDEVVYCVRCETELSRETVVHPNTRLHVHVPTVDEDKIKENIKAPEDVEITEEIIRQVIDQVLHGDEAVFDSSVFESLENQELFEELKNDPANNISGDAVAFLEIKLKGIDLDDDLTAYALSFDVTPMLGKHKVNKLRTPITFYLPVDDGVSGDAYVYHDGEFMSKCDVVIRGGHKYVAVVSDAFSEYVVVFNHVHTEEIIPGTDPMLNVPGLTEGVKCSECGEILVAQEEIPALTGVAEVNGVAYASLAEAVAAANANDVITLQADVAEDEIVIVKKPVTIQANGFAITEDNVACMRYTNAEGKNVQLTCVETAEGLIIQAAQATSAELGEAVAYVDLDNSGSLNAGEETTTLQAALDAAAAGKQTVRLSGDPQVNGTIIIPGGVTLDIQTNVVTIKTLIGLTGSKINASTYHDTNAYGKLYVNPDNLVLSENAYTTTDAATEPENYVRIIPVYDGDHFVFTKMRVNTNRGSDANRGLKIDTEAKTVEFQFTLDMTGAIKRNLLKDGADDNEMSVVVRLEWTTDDGIAYQDFVYNNGFVSNVCSANKDFYFMMKGYDALGITAENLTVKGVVITGNGIEVCGINW